MQPSSVTGRLKSTNTARKDPAKMAASNCANAATARPSTGRAAMGTSPAVKAPQARIR